MGYRVRSQRGGAGVYNVGGETFSKAEIYARLQAEPGLPVPQQEFAPSVRGELAHSKSLCYPVRRVNQSHYANTRKSVILSSCHASVAMLVCGNRSKS